MPDISFTETIDYPHAPDETPREAAAYGTAFGCALAFSAFIAFIVMRSLGYAPQRFSTWLRRPQISTWLRPRPRAVVSQSPPPSPVLISPSPEPARASVSCQSHTVSPMASAAIEPRRSRASRTGGIEELHSIDDAAETSPGAFLPSTRIETRGGAWPYWP